MEPKRAGKRRVVATGLEPLVEEGTEPVECSKGISTFLVIGEVGGLRGIDSRDGMEGLSLDEGSREGPHHNQWGQIRWEISRHKPL